MVHLQLLSQQRLLAAIMDICLETGMKWNTNLKPPTNQADSCFIFPISGKSALLKTKQTAKLCFNWRIILFHRFWKKGQGEAEDKQSSLV